MKKNIFSLMICFFLVACGSPSSPDPIATISTGLGNPTAAGVYVQTEVFQTITPCKEQVTKPEASLTPIPYQTDSSDNQLHRGIVLVEEIFIQKFVDVSAFPVFQINGSMPTPCHLLRIVPVATKTNGQINQEVFSLSDPQEICVQMIESFSAALPLKELTPGDYSIFINGEEKLQFHWPN